MTITAWRFVKAKHAAEAFSGEGARKFGGRWNNPGIPMVYTGSGISPALLELLVHLGDASILPSYVLFRADIRDHFIETLDEVKLPANWRSSPAPATTKTIGDKWFQHRRTAVLSVPSAITPREKNYLLNPAHPDFRKIKVSGPIDYEYDPRIMDLARG